MSTQGHPAEQQLFEFPIDGNYSRRQTRSLIFHLLYAMEEHDYTLSLNAIIDEYNRGFELHIPFDGEIADITAGVIGDRLLIDTLLGPLLENWRIDRLGACTKLVLRMSLWEMINTDTPANVIINEAIELAKAFSEKDAYKFVNGILDRAAAGLEQVKASYAEQKAV